MSDTALQCPRCKHDYITMLYAHVYSRQQDAETGIHVAVILEHQEVTTRSSLHKNPSPRRGGVSMAMVCAECSYIFKVRYYQHKGQIFISTEKDF